MMTEGDRSALYENISFPVLSVTGGFPDTLYKLPCMQTCIRKWPQRHKSDLLTFSMTPKSPHKISNQESTLQTCERAKTLKPQLCHLKLSQDLWPRGHTLFHRRKGREEEVKGAWEKLGYALTKYAPIPIHHKVPGFRSSSVLHSDPAS